MGSLRRKPSVCNLVLTRPILEDVDVSLQLPLESLNEIAGKVDGKPQANPKAVAVPAWEHAFLTEFRCFTIQFQQSVGPLAGLARLDIRLHPCTDSSSSDQNPTADILTSTFTKVLGAEVGFVVVYDFRDRWPGDHCMADVAKLYEDYAEAISGRLKACAILTKDSLCNITAHRNMQRLVAASSACPCLMSHDATSAEDFFRVVFNAASPTSTAHFVSVADVVPGIGPSCTATLTVLGEDTQVHSFHTLPNGDMRVLQSPPQEETRTFDRPSQDQDGRENPFAHMARVPETAGLNAVSFACRRSELKHLVGVHFHIGELAIDADIETHARLVAASSLKSVHAKVSPKQNHDVAKKRTNSCYGCVTDCMQAVKMLIFGV